MFPVHWTRWQGGEHVLDYAASRVPSSGSLDVMLITPSTSVTAQQVALLNHLVTEGCIFRIGCGRRQLVLACFVVQSYNRHLQCDTMSVFLRARKRCGLKRGFKNNKQTNGV